MSVKIRIKIKSYDHRLLDRTVNTLVSALKRSVNTVVVGPIPIPTKKKIFTVLRSPHVNKKSREQFELPCHKRVIDIYSSEQKDAMKSLYQFDMPSGVEVKMEDKSYS